MSVCLSVTHTRSHTSLTHLGHSEWLPARRHSRAQGITLYCCLTNALTGSGPASFLKSPWASDRGRASAKGPREPPLVHAFCRKAKNEAQSRLPSQLLWELLPVTHSPESLASHCHRQLPAQAPRGQHMPARPLKGHSVCSCRHVGHHAHPAGRTLASRPPPRFISILTAKVKDKVLEHTAVAKAGATAATSKD